MQWSNRAMLRLPTENTLDREENIMAEWITTTLEECTDILGDGLHGTPKYTENGEYAFVNGNNLVDGEILIKKETKRVDYSQYDKYKKPLTNRTILVSINGTLGNVGVYGSEKIILGKSACYFNVKESVDKDFIYYIVSSPTFKQYLESNATGTTIKNISLKQMREYTFELPEIGEQKRISSVLRKIDEKIKNNRAINNNLEQQAQAIYQQMFIDNPDPDWIEGSLSDIANITMGQSPSGSSYNEDGIGAIFFQGRAEFSFRFPTIRLYTTEPKRMAYANDILMSVRAPVGDLNVAHNDCCIGRGLAAIHSKINHQSFVLYTMFSLKKQLDVFNGEGTVFGSINRNSLNDMPILIPDDEQIEKFELIVAPMDAAIRNNYDEICRLQAVRDSLLPRLMSGELDVSNIGL
mgnify:CR=1 FL=1